MLGEPPPPPDESWDVDSPPAKAKNTMSYAKEDRKALPPPSEAVQSSFAYEEEVRVAAHKPRNRTVTLAA